MRQYFKSDKKKREELKRKKKEEKRLKRLSRKEGNAAVNETGPVDPVEGIGSTDSSALPPAGV